MHEMNRPKLDYVEPPLSISGTCKRKTITLPVLYQTTWPKLV